LLVLALVVGGPFARLSDALFSARVALEVVLGIAVALALVLALRHPEERTALREIVGGLWPFRNKGSDG
jgi:predicted MFS family arabinose efflux permease